MLVPTVNQLDSCVHTPLHKPFNICVRLLERALALGATLTALQLQFCV